MSKETTLGLPCVCGQVIFYREQHWRVCPERDRWSLSTKKSEKDDGPKKRKRRRTETV